MVDPRELQGVPFSGNWDCISCGTRRPPQVSERPALHPARLFDQPLP